MSPGLEDAVARGIADKSLSTEDQWQRELFARGMFENRVRGSCTSSAIYLDGCLRALGIPTRIVLGIPCIDPSDAREIEMLKHGITHKGVRRIVLQAIEGQRGAWVSHTFDEVWVAGRWRRLNYEHLGQNILDPQYLGLMTHVATFGDWAEGEMAKTWGVRQAKGAPHEDVFAGPNPYSTVSVSDRFGVHAHIPNDFLLGPDEFQVLTIEKAYPWSSPERKVSMDLRDDDASTRRSGARARRSSCCARRGDRTSARARRAATGPSRSEGSRSFTCRSSPMNSPKWRQKSPTRWSPSKRTRNSAGNSRETSH